MAERGWAAAISPSVHHREWDEDELREIGICDEEHIAELMEKIDALRTGGNGEVQRWLESIKVPQYLEVLTRNGYDSLDAIWRGIKSKNQLNAMGVTLKGHQIKIMAEILRLRLETVFPNF